MTAAAPAVRYIVHPSVGSAREEAVAALGAAACGAAVEAKALASPETARLRDVYAIVARALSRGNSPPEPAMELAATCTISVGALRYPTIVLPSGCFVDDNDSRSIASLCATITASPRFVAAAAKAAPVFTVAISAVPMPEGKKRAGVASSSSFSPASAEKKPAILYSDSLRDAPLADRCRYAAATAALALKTARWARGKPQVLDSHSFLTVQGGDIPLRSLLRGTNRLSDEAAEWMYLVYTEAANGSPSVSVQNGRITALTLPPPPSESTDGMQAGFFSPFLGRVTS